MTAAAPAPAPTPAEAGLRIGEVARRVGTTPRTIRYYEELGLLPTAGERESGRHRVYGEADVERLQEALRLKDLLGVSLDQLRSLIQAEETRAILRDEWRRGNPGPRRRTEILTQLLGHVERQLELLAGRRAEIERFEAELEGRRERIHELMAESAP